MKISEIKVYPLKIKKDHMYLGDSSGFTGDWDYYLRPEYNCFYSRNMETLFVKITTDNGLHGWGEALAPVVPEVSATIIEKLFSTYLMGEDPLNTEVIWNKLYNSMRERGYYSGFMIDAVTAIDIALWDICGKHYDTPVFKLLGGASEKRVEAYISGLAVSNLKEKVALAQDWKSKGFKAIKMHLGYGFHEDLNIMKALRESLGDDFRLMIDGHWAYSPKEAIKLGKELEKLDLSFFECPTKPEDLAGNAKITNNLNIDVALGEAERTHHQFKEHLLHDTADIYQPDMGRCGITEMRKISVLAESFNKPIAPHLSVGLGICIAATLHSCISMNNFYGMLEYQPTVLPVANDLLKEPIVVRDGYFSIDEKPGLGVEIDESKLMTYFM